MKNRADSGQPIVYIHTLMHRLFIFCQGEEQRLLFYSGFQVSKKPLLFTGILRQTLGEEKKNLKYKRNKRT